MNDQHPILFNGEMVRAIIAGRKTQTRRLVNRPAMASAQSFSDGMKYAKEHGLAGVQKVGRCDGVEWRCKCPYGVPGDLLWVRETWAYETDFGTHTGKTVYRADGDMREAEGGKPTDKWRPSIHMPRWASRITLLVTGVRVERVQDTTEADARAEGLEPGPGPDGLTTAKTEFWLLWDRINSARGFGWTANPWVWVVEFNVAALGEPET